MTIEIPAELQWVSYLAGSAWPKGDESAMFRIGEMWRASAAELSDLIPDLNLVRAETNTMLVGATGTSADDQFALLFDGDYAVEKLSAAMSAMGDVASTTGTDIEESKVQTLVSLAFAAAEIMYAIAMAAPTLGGSLAWIPPIEAITMAAVRSLLMALLRRVAAALAEALTKTGVRQLTKDIAQEAGEEVVESFLQDTAIREWQKNKGHRSSIGWGDIVKDVPSAFVGGAGGAGGHHFAAAATGDAASKFGMIGKGAFNDAVANLVGSSLGGAAGGGLTPEAFGQLGTSPLSGGLHGSHGHSPGNVPPASEPPGAVPVPDPGLNAAAAGGGGLGGDFIGGADPQNPVGGSGGDNSAGDDTEDDVVAHRGDPSYGGGSGSGVGGSGVTRADQPVSGPGFGDQRPAGSSPRGATGMSGSASGAAPPPTRAGAAAAAGGGGRAGAGGSGLSAASPNGSQAQPGDGSHSNGAHASGVVSQAGRSGTPAATGQQPAPPSVASTDHRHGAPTSSSASSTNDAAAGAPTQHTSASVAHTPAPVSAAGSGPGVSQGNTAVGASAAHSAHRTPSPVGAVPHHTSVGDPAAETPPTVSGPSQGAPTPDHSGPSSAPTVVGAAGQADTGTAAAVGRLDTGDGVWLGGPDSGSVHTGNPASVVSAAAGPGNGVVHGGLGGDPSDGPLGVEDEPPAGATPTPIAPTTAIASGSAPPAPDGAPSTAIAPDITASTPPYATTETPPQYTEDGVPSHDATDGVPSPVSKGGHRSVDAKPSWAGRRTDGEKGGAGHEFGITAGGVTTSFDAWNAFANDDPQGAWFVLDGATKKLAGAGVADPEDMAKKAYAFLPPGQRARNSNDVAHLLFNRVLAGQSYVGPRGGSSSHGQSSAAVAHHDQSATAGGEPSASTAQMQGDHILEANYGGEPPFSSGSGDHAMRPGTSGQTPSRGSAFAAADNSPRSAPPDGGLGDVHGSGATAGPQDTSAGGTGRETRPAPIAGPDNGSGHRGGGVRDVSGGDSGSGLKRGRDDSGDGADTDSDVSRHGKRARIDADAPPEVSASNRHSDTDMDVHRDGHHDSEAGTSRDAHPHRVGDDDAMDVDDAYHHDAAADESPNPHPHTGDDDDNMAVDHVDDPVVDDLTRQFMKLGMDTSQFDSNSKFYDLVKTTKGFDSTAKDGEPGKNPYDDYVQTSVEENRPVSFVVNAIVGADPVPDLKSFVDAVTNNAKDLHGKVVFVIGVNAESKNSVDNALINMKGALDAIDHPVALVRVPWSSSDLKYGTLRNNTMHSEANGWAIDALWSKGTHPYIAVQDFDTGSRNVPSGKHIFNHVIDSMTVGDGLPPSRPLMFGGGYRLGDDGRRNLVADTEARRVRDLTKAEDAQAKIPAEKKELEAEKKQLEAKTKAATGTKEKGPKNQSAKTVDKLTGDIKKVEKKIDKLKEKPRTLTNEINKLKKAKDKIADPDFVKDFERRINQDMDTRVVLAKTSPLLPYTPEPNLFVDAIATKLHSDIKFGDGGAEFSHLGKNLQEAYAKELGKFHDHQTDGIKDNINAKIAAIKADMKNPEQGNPMSPDQARALIEQDPVLMDAMHEIDNQRSNLELDAQNNRHPDRGEVFITDFKGAAVETDLTRIALGYAKDSKVPQSHTDLTGVVDRFVEGRPAKKGMSFSSFRDAFPKLAGDLREPTNLVDGQHGLPKRDYNPDDKTVIIKAKTNKEGAETEPAKTVKDLLGLHEKASDQGGKKEAKGTGAKKAAGGRGKQKETLDQGDKEKAGNPLSTSISKAVPSHDHEGVVAGISPQPKMSPDEKPTLDHHKAFVAVNTAMSGPEALMQRNFGALNNIGDLSKELPPAKGGLFDTVADIRTETETKTPAQLRHQVTNFVSSLTSAPSNTTISTKLADFITDHPTTNGDLVNAIIQPGRPAAFVKSPGWQHNPDAELHENTNPDIHPESTQDGKKSGDNGPDADTRSEPGTDAEAERKQREDDAETATNAEHIAVQVLATTLEKPIHVHEDGDITKYTPFRKPPRKGWPNPIKVYATKQDNGRYTYSATAPASASSARHNRPAPAPLAGGVGAGFGDGGAVESKKLHDNDSGSHEHRTAVGTGGAPSETASTTVGDDRGRVSGDERVPPPAPPRHAASSSGARVVRGGGAPPRLAVSGGSRGGDVLDDESWRHDPGASADWFDPKDPVSQDAWASHRGGAHVRTVNTVVADIRSDSTLSEIKAYDGLINYDLRRIEVEPGKFVQDYTLKVHLAPGSGVDAGTVEAVQAKAKFGVDGLLNQGFRMPSGDQFHVNLEFTDDPAHADTSIEVGGTHTDQTHWNPAASPNVLAHETLHYLGVPDEYTDRGRALLAHDTNSGVHQGDGGMMGSAVLGDDPGLRPRHLWLVERTANSQAGAPGTRLDDRGPVVEGSSPTTDPHEHGPESRPGPDRGLKRGRDHSGEATTESGGSTEKPRIGTGAPPSGVDSTRRSRVTIGDDDTMDVDPVGHRPEAGASRYTHPHAVFAGDVEMGDDTPHSQVDDLARRLGDGKSDHDQLPMAPDGAPSETVVKAFGAERPQVVWRERFPEHSLEAIRLFGDNYPQLRDLNAVHFNAGVQDHMHNCVNVVVSTFETLSGRGMVPHGAPSGRSGELLIEHFDREHHMVSGPQEIVERLVQAGPGSHGVVFQHRAQGAGHVFNALYDERLNSVIFIDAQNGRLGSFDPNDRYGFMLVTGYDPHAPVPMDVDTAFGGPKLDSMTVSQRSLTKDNLGHVYSDDVVVQHRLSAEGNSHERRFGPDEDRGLPEPKRRREDPLASVSPHTQVDEATPSTDVEIDHANTPTDAEVADPGAAGREIGHRKNSNSPLIFPDGTTRPARADVMCLTPAANAPVEAIPLPSAGRATTGPLDPQSGSPSIHPLPGASLPPPGQRRSSLNLYSFPGPATFLALSSSTDDAPEWPS